jgi:N-acetylmuramoyl-L-alanine amidase
MDASQDSEILLRQRLAYLSGDFRTVTASYLNVRSGPGISYPVMKVLRFGDDVNVLDSVNGWAKIDGGWVSEDWLTVP